MLALCYLSPGQIGILDKPLPVLEDGEALLEVEAVGLCGTDHKIFLTGTGDLKVPAGTTLGHEAIATIKEIKGDGHGFMVGDLVAVNPHSYSQNPNFNKKAELHSLGTDADGFFAPYGKAPLTTLLLLSGKKTPLEYSLIEPFSCLLHAYRKVEEPKPEKVVLFGGGLAGMMFLKLFKKLGAEVTLFEPSPERRQIALRLGADQALWPLSEEEYDSYDLFIEASGHIENLGTAPLLLRKGGRVLLYSLPEKAFEIEMTAFQRKEISLYTSFLNEGDFDMAAQGIEDGELDLTKFLLPLPSLGQIKDVLTGELKTGGLKAVYLPNKQN